MRHRLISQLDVRTDERTDGVTDLSFLDAVVDGVQQVGSVLVALGEFGQLLPDQLPLVVAHHPFKCWVHILGHKQRGFNTREHGQLL